MTFTLQGGVQKKHLKIAKKELGKMIKGSAKLPVISEITRPWGQVYAVYKKHDKKNIGLRIVFPVNSDLFDFDEQVALEAVDFVLSNGFSSRLLKTLRSSLGLVYRVALDIEVDSIVPANSYVLIETECAHKNVPKVVETICRVCLKFAREGPTSKEMAKWRTDVKTSKIDNDMDLDPSKYVGSYAPYLQHRNTYPTMTKLDKIAMALTKTKVRKVANEIFTKECMVFHSGNQTMSNTIKKITEKCRRQCSKKRTNKSAKKKPTRF